MSEEAWRKSVIWNGLLDGTIPITYELSVPRDRAFAAMLSAPFKDWCASLDPRFHVHAIHFQSIDMFGPDKIGFIKFKAIVTGWSDQKQIASIVFMRGGSVAVLLILECEGEEYAVLTIQPRFPAGQFEFRGIPAGMLDGSGNFASVAIKELVEECGPEFNIRAEDLIDLTELSGFDRGLWLTAGGSDETLRVFLRRMKVSRELLNSLRGRITGCPKENERITLAVVPLDQLWAIPDAAVITALALYERLKRNGKV